LKIDDFKGIVMADTQWRISGAYFETCNCDFLCPCLESNLKAQPTQGDCIAAMAFRVDDGFYGEVALNGLAFVVVLRTPGPMIEGGWTLGVVIDVRADTAQRDALAAIASGQAGGRPGKFALVTENFAGVEYLPIRFDGDGMQFSLSAEGAVDQAVQGVPGGNPELPMYLDNLGHPASSRLAMANATRSHIHVFGIDWDDDSGRGNGHFAPFDWQGP
jgi:hypothetical protein